MSSISDQIRELQKRLEQINEAPVAAFNQNAGTVPDGAADSAASDASAGSVAVAPEVAVPTTVPQDPNQIPTIEAATFSQAYAQARKQGLKKFKWCGVYAVKDEVKPQPAKPSQVQPRLLGQGPSDAVLKDKYGRPLPKASQDLIRQSYDDSVAGV